MCHSNYVGKNLENIVKYYDAHHCRTVVINFKKKNEITPVK